MKGSALKALETDDPESEEAKCIFELMEAIDSYIPDPVRDVDKPFLMPIEDVFHQRPRDGGDGAGGPRGDQDGGRGGDRRISAHVQDGVHGGGDVSQDPGPGSGGGQHRGSFARHQAGRGGTRAGSQAWFHHASHEIQGRGLCIEKGGRRPTHAVFIPGYRPQFYFRTTDVTGVVTLPEGVEMVMPGDNISMEVHLITPVALEKELRFAVREGGRTVGAGVITEIIQ